MDISRSIKRQILTFHRDTYEKDGIDLIIIYLQ